MPGIYRPRRPERTVFSRVPFHNFDRFLAENERRFEKEYGHFRPVVREVVERHLFPLGLALFRGFACLTGRGG